MQASGPLQQSEEDREKGTQAGRGRERQMESKYMTKKKLWNRAGVVVV